nr:unnamed protein product [Callosobruchus chinensis]
MNIQAITKIRVLENSISYFRMTFTFPSRREANNFSKKFFIKPLFMFAFASYFSIGAVLHMLVNIKRMFFVIK